MRNRSHPGARNGCRATSHLQRAERRAEVMRRAALGGTSGSISRDLARIAESTGRPWMRAAPRTVRKDMRAGMDAMRAGMSEAARLRARGWIAPQILRTQERAEAMAASADPHIAARGAELSRKCAMDWAYLFGAGASRRMKRADIEALIRAHARGPYGAGPRPYELFEWHTGPDAAEAVEGVTERVREAIRASFPGWYGRMMERRMFGDRDRARR